MPHGVCVCVGLLAGKGTAAAVIRASGELECFLPAVAATTGLCVQ